MGPGWQFIFLLVGALLSLAAVCALACVPVYIWEISGSVPEERKAAEKGKRRDNLRRSVNQRGSPV